MTIAISDKFYLVEPDYLNDGECIVAAKILADHNGDVYIYFKIENSEGKVREDSFYGDEFDADGDINKFLSKVIERIR